MGERVKRGKGLYCAAFVHMGEEETEIEIGGSNKRLKNRGGTE